jgi:hypothetical protein
MPARLPNQNAPFLPTPAEVERAEVAATARVERAQRLAEFAGGATKFRSLSCLVVTTCESRFNLLASSRVVGGVEGVR